MSRHRRLLSRRLAGAAMPLLLAATLARAQPNPAQEAANLYMRDQAAGKAPLLAFDRPGATDVPPIPRLLIGVIYLRDGNAGAAVRMFSGVVNDPTITAGMQQVAWNGIGWAELSRGDLDAARAGFQRADTPTLPSPLAEVVIGLIDAGDGKLESAIAYLTPPTTNAQAAPTLRAVARYGIGFARFHSGDYRAAVEEFRAVAADPVAGSLSDDAQYAAGLALYQSGQRDAAISAWRALAGDTEGDDLEAKQIPRGLLRLDPTTWLRMGLRRLRTFPLAAQEIQLLRVLDWDGAALARAMLLRVDHEGPPADDYDPSMAGSRDDGAADAATPGAARRRRRTTGGLGFATQAGARAAAGGKSASDEIASNLGPDGTPDLNDDVSDASRSGADRTASRGNGRAVAPFGAAADAARSHRGPVLFALAGILVAGALWLVRRPGPAPRPQRK